MANLRAILSLDDKQFNRSLDRSKKQAENFDNGIKKLKVGMMGLVGALGFAMGATDAFNTAIKSSQATSDAFDKAIASAKGGVDYFFQAIAQGDFSNFTTGLNDAIRRAGNLALVLDELGDKIAGWDDTSSDITMQIAENRAVIQSEDTSQEERERLIKEQKRLIRELEAAASIVNKQQDEAIRKTIGSIANIDNVTTDEVTDYLQKTSMGIKKGLEDYIKTFEEIKRESEKTNDLTTFSGDQMITSSRPTQEALLAKEKLEIFKEQNAELHRQYQINNLVMDLQRQGVVADRNQLRQRNVMISGMKRQLIRDERRNYETGGAGGKPEEIIPQQSIKAIDNQIRKANDQLLLATTEEARRTWAATIKELEAKKLIIEVQYKHTAPGKIGNVGKEINVAGPTLPTVLSGAGGGSFEAPISALENYKNVLEDARKNNEAFTMSAYAMGDALYAMSGVVGEGAGAWISWGANVLGAVGQAIPAIAALTAVQAASATTAAADAGAKSASAVAGIPIVGPVLAVAAVASIVAALASLPKFEHGGIVGGGSFSGDKMLARVNSGEMILNSGQQRNLFNMINGRGVGGGGDIRVRIQGKELVGILNQEMKRNSRI